MGLVEGSIEFGRTIGIIRRVFVRRVASPGKLIAIFNLRGGLKPNPNYRRKVIVREGNQKERWCGSFGFNNLPRLLL